MPHAPVDPKGRGRLRKIIHIDMDAFYAAIEQRDDPKLRGRPIAVGGASGRSVVATASYEARRHGVRSAMPMSRAKTLCPDLVVVPARFPAYHAVSRQIQAIFRSWTNLVEPLALDEAFLDVTAPLREALPAVDIARRIKAEVLEVTHLTASAGVSFNKFLAKIASGLDKPDGLSLVRPERALGFIAALPIESFHGVGPATAARLHDIGVHTGADLQALNQKDLVSRFGRFGQQLFSIGLARDDRAVEPDRPRRSVSVEETYEHDLLPSELDHALEPLIGSLIQRVARAAFEGRTLVLKYRTSDFRTHSRGRTDPTPITDPDRTAQLARELLLRPQRPAGAVRLLGLGVGNPLDPASSRQLRLAFDLQG